MLTVKQVSMLTGISISALHYYDKIGLLKPAKVTEAGYRLYDEASLQALQQILFFKELDFSLEDIRAIMQNPTYDKSRAFALQKKLIAEKRDRLEGLLRLLDKLMEGENCMSFEEFDMSEYTSALEEFVGGNTDAIVGYGGSLDVFSRALETLKTNGPRKAEVAQIAIKQYGSIEKYTKAMKKNFANYPQIMEKFEARKDYTKSHGDELRKLVKQLTADLTKDVASDEIQPIVKEMIDAEAAYSAEMGIDNGENYWALMAEWYTTRPDFMEAIDKEHGKGASLYIGNALKVYWGL